MDHIKTERLVQVANVAGSAFTKDEMNHLRSCAACLKEFTQIVYDRFGWDFKPPPPSGKEGGGTGPS